MHEFFGNLPASRTRLIGRRDLAALVTDRLLHGDGRLVTLTGVGGVGKTSLGLDVARGIAATLLDGARFVDLGVVDADADVPTVVAESIGLTDQSRAPALVLADYLAARDGVLFLDGCEHLRRPVATLVDRLLDRAPDLRILTTSRVPLRVRGEVVIPVPPLAVPGPPNASLGTGETPASVELFLERARAASPRFEPDADSADAVASICRRLDGVPLAIELAAAGVAVLTPAEIDARLADPGWSGTALAPGADDRRQTMEATLEWSHRLLSVGAQVLLRRLSVFRGGWTLATAAALCGALGEAAIEPAMSELAEHSLIVREPSGPVSRFTFLAPVSQYAAALLDRSGERPAVMGAHAAVFLGLVSTRSFDGGFSAPEDVDRIASEHDNALAALRWAIDEGVAPVAVGLVLALHESWRIRGLLRLGADHMRAVIAFLGDGQVRERELLLLSLADSLQLLGDHERAIETTTDALAIARAIGDPVAEFSALGILGNVASDRADYEAAERWYTQAATIVEAAPSPPAIGFLHASLGALALARHRLDEADAHLERSRVAFEACPPIWFRGRALALLGVVALARGDVERAFSRLVEGLSWLSRYGARTEAIDGLEALARVALAAGDAGRAATLLGAASGIRDATGVVARTQRARRADDVDRARRAMSPEAFSAAWARGRAFRLREATEFAIAHTPPAPSGPGPRGSALTPREQEVVRLVAEGLSNAQIAARLGIAPGTARIHVERILGKLGLSSRLQLAVQVLRGPVSAPDEVSAG